MSETTEASPPTGTSATASSPPPGPEKRRSFFNNLGSRREKRPDATSDTDTTDGEGKKANAGKFGGLFRKPSRAIPNGKNATDSTSPTAKESESPAAVAKETPKVAEPHTVTQDEPSRAARLENDTTVTASA